MDKHGHNFVIFSQATGQTWNHTSAYHLSTLENRRYFGQLEVLWRTVGTPDKCPGQLEVLSMTGDPMMLCDHKVQSNPASVRSKFLGGGKGWWMGGEGVVDGEGGSSEGCLKWGGGGWRSLRDLSKNVLKQGVGKGKSCS